MGGQRLFPPVPPGQSVVYLLDHSMSMGLKDALDRARNELLSSLASLPESSRFQVVVFNRQVELLLPASQGDWLQANPGTLLATRQALLSLVATGSTRPALAVHRALAMRPQQIVLATESDDLSSAEIAELTRFNQGRTAIHIVDLQWRPGREGSGPLRQLAAWNRGSYTQRGGF